MQQYQPPPQQHVFVSVPQKDVGVAYLMWFFLGIFGGHRFYLGQTGLGILYLFTLGLCGVGTLVDLFILAGAVRKVNAETVRQYQSYGAG